MLVSIYIHDDRYSVPTWRTIEIMAEEAAGIARYVVRSNEHYARVELRMEDTLIATATRDDLDASPEAYPRNEAGPLT